ncbi:MAG: (d)CMP kinase [Cyclobacteriaceae bacterium]
MKKINIAIDGYSACGKSTTAKRVASALQYLYIDTGAMYRAVTLYMLDHDVDVMNHKEVAAHLNKIDINFVFDQETNISETFLNGKNVEKEIRSFRVASSVSHVSVIKEVRDKLVAWQREMSEEKGVVMDGRDIGTVVLPDADLKFFMTAEIETRSRRRQIELERSGKSLDLAQIKENLLERDRIDTTRDESPLKKAEEAIEIDTTHLTFEEQIQLVIDKAKEAIHEN